MFFIKIQSGIAHLVVPNSRLLIATEFLATTFNSLGANRRLHAWSLVCSSVHFVGSGISWALGGGFSTI